MGAFNVENLEFVMAVVRAAEDRHPCHHADHPGTVKYANLDYFAAMVRSPPSRQACPWRFTWARRRL